jgi:lipopolysaccharide biosynthesis glycosyltransferase
MGVLVEFPCHLNYEEKTMNKKIIPIFYACDDAFVKYTIVSLKSMIENASKDYSYKIYVLNTNIGQDMTERLSALSNDNFEVIFTNVSSYLESIADRLPLRHYYSKTTYYRLFIPNMYPHLDKALYLDSDIIVTGDISELYNTELNNNLVGAVPDMAVQNTPVFIDYVENALGVKAPDYFNAGILLMNLKEMRAWNFEEKFIDLLSKYSFRVAQDQDYLNVLTNGKIKYVDNSWNVQPVPNNVCKVDKINLIHYNMLWKPWVFDNVDYEDIFWQYAKECPMYEDIVKIKNSTTDECRANKLKGGKALLDMCGIEAKDPNNYKNKFC